jgi:hypothetical protein
MRDKETASAAQAAGAGIRNTTEQKRKQTDTASVELEIVQPADLRILLHFL